MMQLIELCVFFAYFAVTLYCMTENELSNILIGEAIYVQQLLGPGLLESVYEECLVHRLIKRDFVVERQKPIPLFFEEIRLECGFRCDIMVKEN